LFAACAIYLRWLHVIGVTIYPSKCPEFSERASVDKASGAPYIANLLVNSWSLAAVNDFLACLPHERRQDRSAPSPVVAGAWEASGWLALPGAHVPVRLSGVVIGPLLNHQPALAALDAAARLPPYKAPPQAPVLQVKPRNTLAGQGAAIEMPADAEVLEVGASLGIVIGQVACRVREADALAVVAGYTVVNDVRVPHESHYRPAVRQRARDGFCPIGPGVTPASAVATPDALRVETWIDDRLVHATDTAQRVRGVARLIADVSEFMTLQPGDVLMLGPSADAPRVRAGQQVRITIEGVGTLENRFIPPEPRQTLAAIGRQP
jgi:5-oxopent-3-ene-1,2,5-tricarboxylate decarboxylase / 2-hydroxyhepta-2,4-diene-1,7-dioate isomerase